MFPIKISLAGGRKFAGSWLLLPSLLLLLQLRACCEAVVDSSSPNISGFKLRHVDLEAEARARAEQPITSLWLGALHMKESLFVDANYVKCPAYGHLFKLIKRQNKEMRFARGGELLDKSKSIRQGVIQSLAIVATYDRLIYWKLFQQDISLGQFQAENFLEAASELESRKEAKAKEAYLDVLSCLKEYIAPSDRLASNFLEEPSRAEALKSLKRFMSIPVDPMSTPQGLVSNLIKRFDKNDIVVDPDMYERARVVVLGFDDELTTQLRIQEQQRPEVAQQTDQQQQQKPLVIVSGREQEELAREEAAKSPVLPPPSEEEMKRIRLPEDIEIAVPTTISSQETFGEKTTTTEPIEQEQYSQDGNAYTLDQLAILKFIKMRLESKQKTPRLSMRLAFDFKAHFEELLKAKVDIKTDVGREAEAFRRNETNKNLYKRVEGVIEEYLKIIDVLAEIKTLNDDKLESLEEFGGPLERLNRLLDNFDSSFDLNEIRRLQAIWKLKFTEYKTMQNFIDQDGSW